MSDTQYSKLGHNKSGNPLMLDSGEKNMNDCRPTFTDIFTDT